MQDQLRRPPSAHCPTSTTPGSLTASTARITHMLVRACLSVGKAGLSGVVIQEEQRPQPIRTLRGTIKMCCRQTGRQDDGCSAIIHYFGCCILPYHLGLPRHDGATDMLSEQCSPCWCGKHRSPEPQSHSAGEGGMLQHVVATTGFRQAFSHKDHWCGIDNESSCGACMPTHR